MRENKFVKRHHDETRQKLIIGGTRNEFGTRICRKVICEKCKEADYVPVSRSKKQNNLFCRKCAEIEIGAFEKGTKVKPDMATQTCSQCSKQFEIPKNMVRRGPLYCSDCYQGFEIWRGSLEMSLQDREKSIVTRRPAGTVLRTRN